MSAVVNHVIKLPSDDSKLIGIIKNKDDYLLIQNDLDALVKWAKQWKMLFHPGKCKVMMISKSMSLKISTEELQDFLLCVCKIPPGICCPSLITLPQEIH